MNRDELMLPFKADPALSPLPHGHPSCRAVRHLHGKTPRAFFVEVVAKSPEQRQRMQCTVFQAFGSMALAHRITELCHHYLLTLHDEGIPKDRYTKGGAKGCEGLLLRAVVQGCC